MIPAWLYSFLDAHWLAVLVVSLGCGLIGFTVALCKVATRRIAR